MADLTVTLTEAVSLNGRDQGASNAITIGGVGSVFKRIVTVRDDNDLVVANFKAENYEVDGGLDIQNVKYCRVTNLETTHPIQVFLTINKDEDNTAAEAIAGFLINAKESFIFTHPHDGIVVHDSAATVIEGMTDCTSIFINSLSEACEVEVFIASSS